MKHHHPLATALGIAACACLTACPADDGAPPVDDVATTTAPPDATTAPDADVTDPSPGLGIDYDATEPGATPRYEPGATDWLAVGWPTDRSRDGAGGLSLEGFPDGDSAIVADYLAFGEEVLDGFGLNGAIYVQLDGDLDPDTLPSPSETASTTGHLQLVAVTPEAPDYNRPIPLESAWYGERVDAYLPARTLAMRAVYGYPLSELTTYCAVVTRAVQDAEGRYLSQAPAFAEALAASDDLAPLRAWLPDSPLRPEDIAAATCFTTHDATGELVRVAEWIDTLAPAELPDVATLIEPRGPGELHGTYVAPNLQSGDKPYASEGGDIAFDPVSGDPIVQSDEQIRFLLLIPDDRPMPEAGWPLVLYGHGTTGDYESCRSLADEMREDGLAVLCIDQPLHGIRGPDLSANDVEIYSFNFLNPRAGRSGFRQAAVDTLVQSRMAVDGRFDVPAGVTVDGAEVRFDPTRVSFYGHSHGGLAGTLALAVDPNLTGGVISGMAGVLTLTILRRVDPVDFASLVAAVAGTSRGALDTFHPLLTLVQSLVDATDPINYARMWLDPPFGAPSKHVFVTSGTLDSASPYVGTVAAAAAARIPVAQPIAKRSVAHELREISPATTPLSGNVMGADGVPRTAALRQWQGGSHFVVFRIPEAYALWRTFMTTLSYADGPPTIGHGDVPYPRDVAVAAADTCADARPIDPAALPLTLRGNTSLASADYDAEGCDALYDGAPIGGSARDVAYTFRPDVAGRYRFRLDLPSAIDADTPRYGPRAVYVATGCAAAALGMCVAARSGAGSLDVDLDAGVDYTIVVDGRVSADSGPFSLEVERHCAVATCGERECGDVGCGTECGTCDGGQICQADGRCEPPPAGDTCADPIAVDAVPFADSGDTRAFTQDYGYGVGECGGYPFAYGGGSSDVAYRFTAPAAGVYTATLGAEYDGNIYVTGDCDDVEATCRAALRTRDLEGRVRFELGAGEAAFIIVDGAANLGNSAGPYQLRVDACAPDCEGRACGDDGCGGSCGACDAGVTCAVEASCEPFPYVCGATAACEDIPGDNCEAAFEVDALPYEDGRHTRDFTDAYGYGRGWCPGVDATRGLASPEVTYRLTAPEDGLYHVALTTHSGFDANLYVVSSCDDIEGTCLAADDRLRDDRLWVQLAAEETAFVVVDGWQNFSPNEGRYTLAIDRCVPSCEDRICGSDGCGGSCGGCADLESCRDGACRPASGLSCAHPRTIGEPPWDQRTNTAGFDDRASNGCGDGPVTGDASKDMTWRFTAPRDGWFTFRVEADFDAQVYVQRGCGEGATCAAGDGGDRAHVELSDGEQVFVVVDGAPAAPASAEGALTLFAEPRCFPACDGRACGDDGCGGVCGICEVPADVCEDGTCLDPSDVVGNTCGQPFDVGELPWEGEGDTRAAYNHYTFDGASCGGGFTTKGAGTRDQIWRLEAAVAGPHTIALAPDGWDAALYVVRDCADAAGSCVDVDDGEAGEQVSVDLDAGEAVFIVVDGADNELDDAGAYGLRVWGP